MDQMLKIMLGIYAAIILLAGIFGISTQDSAADAQSSLETAALTEKVKSADGDLQGHQPFNQVGFDVDDKSSHRPLNIVRFESEPHQAFNQVQFSQSADKPKFSQTQSDGGVKHQAFNEVKFSVSDKPTFEQSKSSDEGVKHQAFNQVGFDKSSASSFGLSGRFASESNSEHKPLNIVRFEKKD